MDSISNEELPLQFSPSMYEVNNWSNEETLELSGDAPLEPLGTPSYDLVEVEPYQEPFEDLLDLKPRPPSVAPICIKPHSYNSVPGNFGYSFMINEGGHGTKIVKINDVSGTLFINRMQIFSISHSCNMFPGISLNIRTALVFTDLEYRDTPVSRCNHHTLDGNAEGQHVIMCDEKAQTVVYEEMNGHLSVLVHNVFAGKKEHEFAGKKEHEIPYYFACWNSCFKPRSKGESLRIVCTLEDDRGNVLGRDSRAVSVCAAPQRDVNRKRIRGFGASDEPVTSFKTSFGTSQPVNEENICTLLTGELCVDPKFSTNDDSYDLDSNVKHPERDLYRDISEQDMAKVSASRCIVPWEEMKGVYGYSVNVIGQNNGYTDSVIVNKNRRLFLNSEVTFSVDHCLQSWRKETLRLRTLVVFEDFPEEPGQRCSHHQLESKSDPYRKHMLLVPMDGAEVYETYQADRPSVVVPFKCTEDDLVCRVRYRFVCRGACFLPPRARANSMRMVFILEDDNKQIVGRASVEVRVCAAPKRDAISDVNRPTKRRYQKRK